MFTSFFVSSLVHQLNPISGYVGAVQRMPAKEQREREHAVVSGTTKQDAKRRRRTPPPMWAENLAGAVFAPGGFYRRPPVVEKRTWRRLGR